MGIIRSVFSSALLLGLAACATEESLLLGFLDRACIDETAKRQIPASWDRANVINIAVQGGVYDLGNIQMKVGEPTILRIANNDDVPRYFIDGEFLGSVALAEVSVGDVTYDRPCISGVVIGAGKKAELRLVPLKAGVYLPEGNPVWFLGFPQGRPGYIDVKG